MLSIRLCAFADEASPCLTEQIAALKENGIPYLELRGVNGKNVFEATPEEAAKWKRELDANGIKVWSVGSPIGKTSPDCNWEEYLSKVKNLFEIAKVLECRRIRMFSFFTATPEKHADFVVEKLNELCLLAKEYDLVLCHENEKEIFGDIAKRCRYLLDNVPMLNAIFDPANFVQCGQDIKEALELVGGDIDYYHIKDALMKNGAVVPAGKGDGEIPAIIDSISHDTVLTLEPHLTVFEGYSSIDRTELLHEYVYPSPAAAFKAATDSLKEILKAKGFVEEDQTWKK